MGKSQCQPEGHRRALSKIHVVQIGARRPQGQPLVHRVAQVGDDEIILAYDGGQSFETIESLHRNVSPENKMQIGFCQAKAELTASLIAPSIFAMSLTLT